jgi:hypothetical protein
LGFDRGSVGSWRGYTAATSLNYIPENEIWLISVAEGIICNSLLIFWVRNGVCN